VSNDSSDCDTSFFNTLNRFNDKHFVTFMKRSISAKQQSRWTPVVKYWPDKLGGLFGPVRGRAVWHYSSIEPLEYLRRSLVGDDDGASIEAGQQEVRTRQVVALTRRYQDLDRPAHSIVAAVDLARKPAAVASRATISTHF
jgi:hypothetical protein